MTRPIKQIPELAPSVLAEFLNEEFSITSPSGDTRKLDAVEVTLETILQDAFKGIPRAVSRILRMIAERDAARLGDAKYKKVTVSFTPPTPNNADEALILLGITAVNKEKRTRNNCPYLELEPDFVQVAMKKYKKNPHPGTLREWKDHTRNPEEVNWPSPREV